MSLRLALGCLCLALPGCIGAPTPLAPGLHGSVGVPHRGVQTDADELPRAGAGFVRFRPRGQHYWGVPRLVHAIAAAAEAVALAYPESAPLVVGDLSAQFGGKIRGHNSHRSGRDVDLLYYVTTPNGVPVQSPGFVRVESDGLAYVPDSRRFVRIDLPRQWFLVKSLLTDPTIGVQFLFMSRSIEALLIDYALSRGEPLDLVHRAQTVLLQPTDSLPHDDHMHLRVSCAPEEFVSGCDGGGPYWEWLPAREVPLPVDDSWLAHIASDDPWPGDGVMATATAGTPGGA